MDIQQILTELDEFKKDKLSAKKKEEWESKVSELLDSLDGINALRERLEPKIKIKRPILRLLVSQIQSYLDSSEATDINEQLIDLLESISRNDKVNSDARWSALSVILNANPPNSYQILVDVLKRITPQKDLSDKYMKYAFEHITPDGGLPYLLDLYIQDHKGYEKWLPDLLEQVSKRLYEKETNIDQRSLEQIGLYFEKEGAPFKDMDRPLILLATKSPDTLRTSLELVLNKLSTEDSKRLHWKDAIVKRIKEVLDEDVEKESQPIVERPDEEKVEPAPIPSTNLEDLKRLSIQNSRKLERLIEDQHKAREDEHRRIENQIANLQKIFESSQVVQLFLQLKEEKEKNTKLQEKIDKTEQDYYRTIDELEQEKALNADIRNENEDLQKKLDKAQTLQEKYKEEKQRIENSNQRIKIESVDFAKNFCIDVVSTLDLYLKDAKDPSYPTATDREKSLLESLREIHFTLQRLKKQRLEELENMKID